MDRESGEDRISNLPDSVVSHILSRLPTKVAVQTSILSKDWEYKWTSVYNIQLSEYRTGSKTNSQLGKRKNNTNFVSLMDRILHLTQNSTIKSLSLSCSIKLDSQYLKTWISNLLMRGVGDLEICTYQCHDNTFVDGLYNYRSLTVLKLDSRCTLSTSLMKDCFNNLKILWLSHGVQLSTNGLSKTDKLVLNFPVLEELELKCPLTHVVKCVEINAHVLIRLRVEGQREKGYQIKIDGAKLEKFESREGFLENLVFNAPSVLLCAALTSDYLGMCAVLTKENLRTTLTNRQGDATTGFRAHEILKNFPALEYLKLSRVYVNALIESNRGFPLPCFNRLKQLDLCDNICKEALVKLLQMMPSLEMLSLYVEPCWGNDDIDYMGLSLPSGIVSGLKVVKLNMFRGTAGQIHLAKYVLKAAENLEKLFVFACNGTEMPKTKIMSLLSAFPKSSTRASIVVHKRWLDSWRETKIWTGNS